MLSSFLIASQKYSQQDIRYLVLLYSFSPPVFVHPFQVFSVVHLIGHQDQQVCDPGSHNTSNRPSRKLTMEPYGTRELRVSTSFRIPIQKVLGVQCDPNRRGVISQTLHGTAIGLPPQKDPQHHPSVGTYDIWHTVTWSVWV